MENKKNRKFNKKRNENNEEENNKKKNIPKYPNHLPGPYCKGVWKHIISEMKNPKKYANYNPEDKKMKEDIPEYPKFNKKKRTVLIKSKNGEINEIRYKSLADLMIPKKGRKRMKNVRMPTTKGRK